MPRPERDVMTFGEAIKEARRVLKLSQKELAQRCGISAQYLNDIEHDRRIPADEVRAALGTHTKIGRDYLDVLAGRIPYTARRENPNDILRKLMRPLNGKEQG